MKFYLTNAAVLWFALVGSALGQFCFWMYFAPTTTFNGVGTLMFFSPQSNPMSVAVWEQIPDSAVEWLIRATPTWIPFAAIGTALVGALNGGLIGIILVWILKIWPRNRDEAAVYALKLAESQREPEWKVCLKRPTVLWWTLLASLLSPFLLGELLI